MKWFRLLFSYALIFALVVSTVTVSYGATVQNQLDDVNTNEWTFKESDEEVVVIRTVDYPNGDACTYMIINNEITYSSYLDRSESQIVERDYEANLCYMKHISADTHQIVEKLEEVNQSERSFSFTYAGDIGYTLTRTVQGETYYSSPTLKVEYDDDEENVPDHDLNGKYRNQAALVSTVAGLLAIPAKVAFPVCAKILSDIGIISSIVEFSIPKYIIRALYYTVTWHGQGFTEAYVLEGTKYTFYFPDGSIEYDYDDDYYPINSFRNRDNAFAMRLGNVFYPGFDEYEIHW